ncbi:MarR family winged helix-turn-helix transcriptional regulator [Protaetiibacter mangrovi]|uniref:MarR family transcriptional regulator n=1 Tax=Protaetiibacter mangrovi TaxID=2970926 RepID=A0ABT1ZCF2_9MICO|nr:MarR family transcriptional regulator [Protaetiibacter mangrovi]MCS0498385.1 MarR family transcriptional regulator [Protaetiibacter mangrovi]TPX03400.1 MarR family transcriptional regulator [Schumannella luteola]
MAEPEDDLVDTLAHSAFVVIGALTRIAAEHDVSLTLVRVLGILRDHRRRMAELADRVGVDRSTMSGLVDRAAQRGLLARHPDPDDRRSVRVDITPAGRELAARIYAQLSTELAPLLDRVPEARRAGLAAELEALLD